jgi:quaternary ammonium compound-resistance protein SugE
MAWMILILAGFMEVAWAMGLKYSDGFRRPLVTVPTLVAVVGSLYLLSVAARTIPIGTAYPVWTGIGAVGTALLGMWFLGESRDPLRLVSIGLIVAGIAGLKFLGARDDL